MPYLLDSDVFVRAGRDHFRFAVCPGFWQWLEEANRRGDVFSIDKVRDEITVIPHEIASWAARQSAGFFLPSDGSIGPALRNVSNWANTQRFTLKAINTFFSAADFLLVAHGLSRGYTVVTHEVSAPNATNSIKLPDACRAVGVAWTTPFQMLEDEGASFVLK